MSGFGGDQSLERELLRESAVKLCSRRGGPARFRAALNGRAEDPLQWSDVLDAGWLLAPLREEHGGLGQGLVGLLLLLREAGRELVTVPVAPVCAVLVSSALGSPHIFQRLYPTIVEQGLIVVPAFQEQPVGIDFKQAMRCCATIEANGDLTVVGSKIAVPCSSTAHAFVVSANSEQGLILFYVDSKADGLCLIERLNVDGTRSTSLTFSGVRVPAADLLFAGEAARAQAEIMLGILAIGAAAELIGLAEKSYEASLEYLKYRRQFGRLIGSFQAMQHFASVNFVDLEMGKNLAYGIAESIDNGERAYFSAFAAKSKMSEVALSVTKGTIQVFGATGFTDDCDAHLYLRRAIHLSGQYGTSAHFRRAFLNSRTPHLSAELDEL